MTCKECKYFVSVLGFESGNCRRYPPPWSMLSGQEWSQVLPTEWCGEFEQKVVFPSWSEMKWTPYQNRIFASAGIDSVEQLTRYTEGQLCGLKGFGWCKVRDIKLRLAGFGLALSGDSADEAVREALGIA